eukprot:2196819-Amphidinium_carterae.3
MMKEVTATFLSVTSACKSLRYGMKVIHLLVKVHQQLRHQNCKPEHRQSTQRLLPESGWNRCKEASVASRSVGSSAGFTHDSVQAAHT